MSDRFRKLPSQEGERGRSLTAYLVLEDGEPIGTVFQVQRRWSRMGPGGRYRIRDFYPVRWGYSRKTDWTHHGTRVYSDSEGYPQDRREWAVERLMELREKGTG